MSKPKNLKELYNYVEKVRQASGNIKLYAGTVWNLKQLAQLNTPTAKEKI
jgi:hypothetical protein